MKDLDAKFKAYHRTHPWVYDDLVRLAIQAKISALAVGRRRSGTKRHFEDLRWPNIFRLAGQKLNNNNTSRYARLIEEENRCSAGCRGCLRPTCLAGVFEKRALRTSSVFGGNMQSEQQQPVLL